MNKFVQTSILLFGLCLGAHADTTVIPSTPFTRNFMRQSTQPGALNVLGIVPTNGTVIIPPDNDRTATNGSGQLIVSNAVVAASMLWVDANGTSSGLKGAYTTLHAALAVATSGKAITVNPGTYNEGTNICIVPAGVSVEFKAGALLLFTPSAVANDVHSYCQIELASNVRLFGPGIIRSTPTNAADSSEMIGFGKNSISASNAVVDGLTLQGDAIAFRNLSTNTVTWKVQNCTTMTTDGFVQGVNGTSTLTSSNSMFEVYNNRIYLTNDSILTASVIRRAFVEGIYGGSMKAVGNMVTRSDYGTAIPCEVFENKTTNPGRWVTNGYFFKDLVVDDTAVTNAVSYGYKISAGYSTVFQNVTRTDGQLLTADPAGSALAVTYLPNPSGGALFVDSSPALSLSTVSGNNGFLLVSNKVLYLITTTKTNLVSNGQ